MSENEIVTQETISLGMLQTSGPRDVIARATGIASELAKVIKNQKLFSTIQGRNFVKVEGWTTLGAMLGVLPREVPGSVRRFDDGSYEAAIELVRVNDGAIIGGASAYVGMDEKDSKGKLTWGNRPEYARRSMAVTRATGKAFRLGFSWIVTLAGFEPTPAEEMDGVIEGQIVEHKPEPTTIPEPPELPKPSSEIDLATARTVTTLKGALLGDLSYDKLYQYVTFLQGDLKKNSLTKEQRDDKQYKIDAALTVMHDLKTQPA